MGGPQPGDVAAVHEPVQVVAGGLVGDVEFFGELTDMQSYPAAVVDEAPEMAVNIGEGDTLPAAPAIETLGVRPKGRVVSLRLSRGSSCGFSWSLALIDGRKLMVRRTPVSMRAPVRG